MGVIASAGFLSCNRCGDAENEVVVFERIDTAELNIVRVRRALALLNEVDIFILNLCC